MMRDGFPVSTFLIAATAIAASFIAVGPTMAQETQTRRQPAGSAQRVPPAATVTYRGLTISRPPGAPPSDEADIYRDGPIRYKDIRDFSPAPYATSGVQLPYGLDGIGGYGSDLGFSAGQDTALYNRGAGAPQ